MKRVLQSIVLLLSVLMLPASALAQNIYGDVNGDYEVNIADVNVVIDVILSDVNNPNADVNGDGEINIADINAIIDIILGGGIDQHLLEVCERVVEIDNEIIDYYEQCTSIDELMTHKDEIEAMDGVEYVFSNDNTTMYVVIKDFGTISYSYFPKLLKSNTPNLQIFKYEAGGLMANADVTHCNNINPSDAKALIAFQMSKDEGSSSVTDYSYCEILNTYFKYAGIDSRIETSLDIKFFRDSIFDCDYLLLLTHGDYEFNPDKYKKDKTYRGIHWVFTTEELPTDSHEEARFLREIKKKYSEDDVSYGTIKETHNGVDVGVRYLKVSDHFIESSNKSFDHPGKAIVFNTACHSMQGPGILENNEDKVNYNFGRVFARCGAGAYYGYDQSNSHGSACASQLFTYLISGMSVQSAYDNLQFEMLHDHKFDESTNTWHWADLIPYYVNEDFKNSCITKPLIDYRDVSNDNELSIVLASGIPAFSIVFSDISYEYDDNNNFVETFEDNYTDLSDILRYGFELSESEQFVDAISLGEKRIGDEGCKWLDNPPMYLNFKESLTYSPSDSDSKIKPGTTYWARAYVYDGSGYNYSEPITFTTGSISGGTQEHEWVDLGLPSGTLWATCNVGANTPEECGGYFAWGETEPKESYDLDNYKWCNGSRTTMTKYCTNSNYGTVDNKSELDPEDDAATVNWGSSWRMPSREQQQELITNCTWQWVTRNGVDGGLATGPNGNTIFFPAVGFCSGGGLNYPYSQGRYLSRTLDQSIQYMCYCIKFDSRTIKSENTLRHLGYTVRAVRVSQN